jgi:predicted ATPase
VRVLPVKPQEEVTAQAGRFSCQLGNKRSKGESLECEVTGAASSDELALAVAAAGEKDRARQMLSEIYNWFTEGFDTADLQEAKALLEELG